MAKFGLLIYERFNRIFYGHRVVGEVNKYIRNVGDP